MSYEFRTAHPVLRWLPPKLAEWIGANLSEELLIPDKNEDKWTAAELNNILPNSVVRGPWSSSHVWWQQMGMRPVQREAQGAMLTLQYRRPSFPG